MAQSEAALAETISRYHADQRRQGGWLELVALLGDELCASVGEEDAEAFFRHVGSCLADRQPLPSQGTLGELEAALNRLLAEHDWGFCRLSAKSDAILIQHYELPSPRSPAPSWTRLSTALLAGLFETWINGQGGSARVTALAEIEAGGRAFNYG